MNLKKQFINAFLEEVVRLNGTEFEEIGRYVMELITNQELIQKGHNPHGKPVGYTVDYEQLAPLAYAAEDQGVKIYRLNIG